MDDLLLRDAWVEIDREKLRHNFLEIKRVIGEKTKICAVLKAQAYGMGAVLTAGVIDPLGADMYAVACLSEALELRRVIPEKEILILGYVSEDLFDTVIREEITLTMYRQEMIRALERHAAKVGKRARIQIKVNTGMNRIGFAPSKESIRMIEEAAALPHIQITGIFTHLATGEEGEAGEAARQEERFRFLLESLRERNLVFPSHIAASEAICNKAFCHYDMVRPGLMLTGCYSGDEIRRDLVSLKPCVKVKARLGNIMKVCAGEGVGYGHTVHLEKDTVLGLLPLGFSDGLPRSFSNDFSVTIRGIPCPVVGRICMDHCVIDVSAVPDPRMNEEIVVFGEGINSPDRAMNIEEAAKKRGTVPDEVLTNLSARLPRILV